MIGHLVAGKYEVLDWVGEGGFGTVYRCLHRALDKIVAVKMLTREGIDERHLERFLVEGKNLAKLDHPNVIRIFDAGVDEDRPYLVMEYIEGLTLRTFLVAHTRPSTSSAGRSSARSGRTSAGRSVSGVQSQSRDFEPTSSLDMTPVDDSVLQPESDSGGLSLSRIVAILSQVARGLHAIHDEGIIHRDLSVNNVMVTESGVAKILDLGLSSVVDSKTARASIDRIAGTLTYIAPEILNGHPATFSSDIFSFGVLAYEAISGGNPFRGEDTSVVLNNIAHRSPAPLDTVIEGVPPRLGRLVEHCLKKDPADRLPSLEGVAELVLRFLQESPSDPDVAEFSETHPETRAAPANPYLNRVMIRRHGDFFGRKQEIRRIYSRLNATPPGSVSIVGDRRIGKSSLLNYIRMQLNRDAFLERPDEIVMVFMDLQQEPDMKLSRFVDRLIGRTQAELEGRLEIPTLPGTLDGMKSLVQRLSHEGYRLVILLDEFELVTTNQNFSLEFYSFLRFLANHYDVVYITSSVKDLQVLCHTREISDSPFFNIFSTMRLTAFGENEARELITAPARRIGITLAPHHDYILRELSGPFPMFIQIACSHFVECLGESGLEGDALLAQVRHRYYEEARPHYQFIWDSFKEHERRVVSLVVHGRAVPESLRDVLVELETKKYVIPDEGSTRLFSATFQQFASGQVGPDRTGFGWNWLKKLTGRRGD